MLRGVRRRGWAEEDGEVTPGLASVAHAAVDHTGLPVAGIALTFWSDDAPPARRAELAAAVGHAAAEVSRRLGARATPTRPTSPTSPTAPTAPR